MAGFNSRFLYDQCTFDQNLRSSTEPCRYQLVVDKFENNNMGIQKDPCIKGPTNYSCKTCDINSTANIESTWDTIGIRTDIESDLLVLNLPNSRCVDIKYHPCGNLCNKPNCVKKCPNPIIVNTRVCDRNIVPTNNKMPTNTGF